MRSRRGVDERKTWSARLTVYPRSAGSASRRRQPGHLLAGSSANLAGCPIFAVPYLMPQVRCLMNPPVTMRQIAERADVSIGTVSHVINDTAKVREKLRQRVLDAIRSLGYQPSQLARGLRRNQTNILVMIIPDITNPFFPAVVRGVEDVAYNRSFRLALCNTDNDAQKETLYLNEMRSYRPAGWLVIPATDSQMTMQLKPSAASGTPVVCIDRQPDGWKGDVVLAANQAGARSATQHLLRMGHRQLAVITGPLHLTNAVERLKGFKNALAEANVSD